MLLMFGDVDDADVAGVFVDVADVVVANVADVVVADIVVADIVVADVVVADVVVAEVDVADAATNAVADVADAVDKDLWLPIFIHLVCKEKSS